MMKFSKCIALLFLTTVPLHAVMATQISIELRAAVSEVCTVGAARASFEDNTTTLRVAASCNTPRYLIKFSGVNDLRISNASSGAIGKNISTLNDQILVRQAQPGGHELEIELNNSIADLTRMAISIQTVR